jgi:hypothetical protein
MWSGRGKIVFFLAVAAVLSVSGCLFSPSEKGSGGGSGYYTPADSAWKVIHNLQLAYTTKNIDAYMDCLHEEFEFFLLEVDWADYTGDGVIDESWGRDIEESMTTNMFNSYKAETIELTLNGTGDTEYPGDPTGDTRQLVRSFDLKVYYMDGGEQHGYRAMGDAIFLCKPNEDGEYEIWHWIDQSAI